MDGDDYVLDPFAFKEIVNGERDVYLSSMWPGSAGAILRWRRRLESTARGHPQNRSDQGAPEPRKSRRLARCSEEERLDERRIALRAAELL